MNPFDLKYQMLGKQAIGVGGQAKVFLCKDIKDGDIFVLKEIDLRPVRLGKDGTKRLAQLRRELEIHSSVSHPHIVKCIEFFETRDQSKMQIVLEYCSEGDVMDYMDRKMSKSLDESEAKKIVRQVASALKYLHENKLLHRDIKPENILLSSNFDASGFPICKITDFGVSKELNGTVARTFTGPPIYMAPEITSDESINQYSYPADMWALGVSLYVMLFSSFPEFDNDFNAAPKGKKWDELSAGAKSLMVGLIRCSPSERLTAEQVLECDWLKE